MKKHIILTSVLSFFLILGCSSDDDGGDPPVVNPSASTLIFPDNNQECNEGVESSATQSTVTFRWNASDATDSYEVVLKNLDSQIESTHSATTNELAITILKATPYSWYVVSKSNSSEEDAQSPIWKFYNAGDAEQSHAPFPADLVAPAMGLNYEASTTSVTLMWQTTDIDGDLTNYDVLIGTTSPPTSSIVSSTTSTSFDATVSSGNTYYWRVIANDAEGNSSQSEVFQFRVN